MQSSGDTDVICLVSGGELAWFLMCTLLLTQTVTCCHVSASELAWFLICPLLVTLWPVLCQEVSLVFNVHASADIGWFVLFQVVSLPGF